MNDKPFHVHLSDTGFDCVVRTSVLNRETADEICERANRAFEKPTAATKTVRAERSAQDKVWMCLECNELISINTNPKTMDEYPIVHFATLQPTCYPESHHEVIPTNSAIVELVKYKIQKALEQTVDTKPINDPIALVCDELSYNIGTAVKHLWRADGSFDDLSYARLLIEREMNRLTDR